MKFLKANGLLLLFLSKNFFFILGMAHADPFVVQIGPGKAIFVEVLPYFFQNY